MNTNNNEEINNRENANVILGRFIGSSGLNIQKYNDNEEKVVKVYIFLKKQIKIEEMSIVLDTDSYDKDGSH
jgi:hypothetical protein